MGLKSTDITERTNFFSELLHCNEKIILATYNVSGSLVKTNAKNMFYDTMLRYSKRLDNAILFGESSNAPVIITVELGIMWSVVFEYDEYNQLQTLHVMGPILSSVPSEDALKTILKRPNIRQKWKEKLVSYIKDIPIVPVTNFFNYTLMLHYCVNSEYLNPSAISFLDYQKQQTETSTSSIIDYENYWVLENQMAEFIRNGDIYYKGKIRSASSILSKLQPIADNDFTTAKQLATAFCGLCIRAAIDGGISPDTAYTKGNAYLNNIASTNSIANIISICQHVFEDFLHQVHARKNVPKYSKEIRICIDYIETHSDEELSIDFLAKKSGYSTYYLSKKFKAEVGMNINSYIKKTRIQRASYLLLTTDMDIQDISDFLHFGNRNFFTKVFKEEIGMSPAHFRKCQTQSYTN